MRPSLGWKIQVIIMSWSYKKLYWVIKIIMKNDSVLFTFGGKEYGLIYEVKLSC